MNDRIGLIKGGPKYENQKGIWKGGFSVELQTHICSCDPKIFN